MSDLHKLKYTGLTDAEVLESRKTHGINIITPPEKEPWWKLYLEKYEDPVIRILMIAAVIAIAAGTIDGKYIEGIGIIIAILLATTLAFLNEFKANKEFDLLNKVNDEVAVKAIRNGCHCTVPRKDIVVGDIVILETGEEVPADGIIWDLVALQIDESKLTGESEPVEKKAVSAPLLVNESSLTGESNPVVKRVMVDSSDSNNSAYADTELKKGTMVVDGHCTVQITSVGDNCEIGKIFIAGKEESEIKSPLNIQLERLSKQIGVVGLSVAVLTYAALILRDLFTGVLILTQQQLFTSIVIHIFLMIVLIKVWLPIVYDFFDWIKLDSNTPDWLEAEGIMPWVSSLILGGIISALVLGSGYLTGLLSADTNSWFSLTATMDFLRYFMIAVTIIVVAVPEGLAMSVTLSLAYSMRKMTASNNLVRKMDACETIGAATCICSDKTGTLTHNEMKVFAGEMYFDWKSTQFLTEIVAEGLSVNSTANLGQQENEVIGNPTEGAILLWLRDNGIDYLDYRDDSKIIHQWTFSNETKMMGTAVKSGGTNDHLIHIKGAPEIILNKCSHYTEGNGSLSIEKQRAKISNELLNYQKRGMRTIGFAYHKNGKIDKKNSLNELPNEFIWLGFFAIADPIREEVPLAVLSCKESGIDVKIVTGDNPQTAEEIARQIKLIEDNDFLHLTGKEFENMDDNQASSILPKLRILSRAKPMDKLRLVKLLRKAGHIVAVTGDGTNDAPALNHADVGLAMGKNGTALAKEVSDVILLDDSFKSIVNAVMWGRSLYANIQRFILFQLTINVAALGIALSGPFLGVHIPLTVTQMLWVNLIMDTFAALALATEPPKESVMKNKPRSSSDYIVTGAMGKQIFGVGFIFLLILGGILVYIQNDGVTSDYELSVFFSIFVMLQFWNLFNARALFSNESALKNVFKNKGFVAIASAIFVGQILIIQIGGEIFRTVPLKIIDWVLIVLATSIVLVLGEFWRLIRRRMQIAGTR